MIDFTALIEALIGVLATLITYKLIPWIIANTNAKQQLILKTVADTAVYAAEQLYKGNGRLRAQVHGRSRLQSRQNAHRGRSVQRFFPERDPAAAPGGPERRNARR